MNYWRQILFDLRNQSLITWLSLIGTTITIFLIMCDFMISNIDSVSIPPESRQSRILYGYGAEIRNTRGGSNSSSLSYELANELYSGLEGVELISFVSDPMLYNTSSIGGIPESRRVICVDENYWNIYDYSFEEGQPFSREEVESGVLNTILSRSTAEKFFGKQDSYLGRNIKINNKSYTVTGIIGDVNPLMDQTSADAFISHVAAGLPESNWMTYLGDYSVVLLLKDGTDATDIKHMVEQRYNIFSERHKGEGIMLVYHDQPWNLEQRRSGAGSNITPDLTHSRRMRIMGYAILLLIPAINLSSMTRNRMRKRIGEIGLRRAFGCTRFRIMIDLLAENAIITLAGGLIGLLLSFIFIAGFSNYFVGYAQAWTLTIEMTMARPTFRMLFNWNSFLVVILFCLLLNLLSAGIPALRAAFTDPAEAITGQNVHK